MSITFVFFPNTQIHMCAPDIISYDLYACLISCVGENCKKYVCIVLVILVFGMMMEKKWKHHKIITINKLSTETWCLVWRLNVFYYICVLCIIFKLDKMQLKSKHKQTEEREWRTYDFCWLISICLINNLILNHMLKFFWLLHFFRR